MFKDQFLIITSLSYWVTGTLSGSDWIEKSVEPSYNFKNREHGLKETEIEPCTNPIAKLLYGANDVRK